MSAEHRDPATVDATAVDATPQAQSSPSLAGMAIPERRIFRVLALLAFLLVVLAVLVNWMWGPEAGGEDTLSAPDGAEAGTSVSPVDLDKPPLDLLPDRIIGYETITRQDVPGSDQTVAEAIYATLSMDIEIQRPITVYVRVEGYADASTAAARKTEVMSAYTTNPASMQLGGAAIADTGYTADEGSFMVAWSTGQHLVLVKAMFREQIPADRRDFLERQARPVAEAIEKFQRTGEQGITR
jgi:hypothetical protein